MKQEILDAILEQDCVKIKENYKGEILVRELKKMLDVEGEKYLLPPMEITPTKFYQTGVYSKNSDKMVNIIFSVTTEVEREGYNEKTYNVWKFKEEE